MSYTPEKTSSSRGCDYHEFEWTCDDGDEILIEQYNQNNDAWYLYDTLNYDVRIYTSYETLLYHYPFPDTLCAGLAAEYRIVNVYNGDRYESNSFTILCLNYSFAVPVASGVTCNSIRIIWDNGGDCLDSIENRNIILRIGATQIDEFSVFNGDFTLSDEEFTITGLTANTTYNIQMGTAVCIGSTYPAAINVTTLSFNAGTIATGQTICYNGNPAAFTSVADASGGVTGYTYQWQYSTDSGGTWTDIVGANSTTYDSSNLTTTRWFRRRVIDSGSPAITGYSNTVIVTVYPLLYAGEIADNQSICSGSTPALLTSTHDASGASGSYVYQWQYSTNGIGYFNIGGAIGTTYQPPALTETTYYKRRVYDTFCGIAGAEYSNVVLITVQPPPPTDLPTPFCEGSHWTASGSTCGNSDGYITIIDNIPPIFSYFDIYDFTLTDIWGTTYTFNTTTGEATGLTSGYYFLTATVKPEYWYYYGRETCTFDWIKIEDTDNPAFLVGVSVKPQQCGPFDRQFGRIFYNVSGLTSGNTYSFYAFTSDLSLYYSKTGITSTEDFILANASAECYWVLIRDEVTGCALLLDNRCVPSIPFFSLGGIKKLYIAKWTDDLDVDFWKDSDEDYFLEFADTSFFTSTKIKQYKSLTGGTIQWYSIPVLPKVCKLSQTLGKVRQGYIFTTSLTIGVAKANASKWKEMSTILNPENKWIFIVQDADNFWWTGGAQFGARISMYQFKTGARGEDEGYTFEIQGIENNKILTSIDTDYVNTYVI